MILTWWESEWEMQRAPCLCAMAPWEPLEWTAAQPALTKEL